MEDQRVEERLAALEKESTKMVTYFTLRNISEVLVIFVIVVLSLMDPGKNWIPVVVLAAMLLLSDFLIYAFLFARPDPDDY